MIEFNNSDGELILTCEWCGAEVDDLYNMDGDQVCEACVFKSYEEKAVEYMEVNKIDAAEAYAEADEQNRIEAEEDLAESWRDREDE